MLQSNMFCSKTLDSEKHGCVSRRQKSLFDGILSTIGRAVGGVLICVIWLYQNTLGMVFPPSCRFHPSCSEYSMEALRRYGPLKGGWLSARRLLRCHPFNPGGYDPLP